LSAHKTKQLERFQERNPRVNLHFTPTYSSWFNQVEIWFARLEREAIARGIFTSVKDLSRKLLRYIRAYSKAALSLQMEILRSSPANPTMPTKSLRGATSCLLARNLEGSVVAHRANRFCWLTAFANLLVFPFQSIEERHLIAIPPAS
jgi:hypothetical protein